LGVSAADKGKDRRVSVAMTADELEEMLSDCPTLYHMAELGSWPSIRERGLLSTCALLDLYKVNGDDRARIEELRRPENVTLIHADLPRAVVRDQIPMDDVGLKRALPAHMKPSDWYKLLNQKVFFWLTRERLLKLLGAGAYRNKRHDVIELNTRSLVEANRDRIWLCPINSGCTKPFPHPRDEKTFSRIDDYPYSYWKKKRKAGERVVELSVDYGVTNLSDFVTRVVEMQGDTQHRVLFP
jgi:hypothetical protein